MNPNMLVKVMLVSVLVLCFCFMPQRGEAQVLLRREVSALAEKRSHTSPTGGDNKTRQSLNRLHATGQPKLNPGDGQLVTIPYWTGSFNYHGISYSYNMVGTDPSLGSATTVVPTVIVPLRFVFADGSVEDVGTELFEGQTAATAIANSPLFNPYPFNVHGVMVGNTQYPDAFQRANFWNFVSTRSRDYHVLLGAPLILTSQTINVPADKGHYGPNPGDSFVDFDYMVQQVQSLIGQLNLSPRSLPIFVTGNTTMGFSLGFHSTFFRNGAVQTYAVACYLGQTTPFSRIQGQDIFPVSHEILEWLDDPFTFNLTPGWDDLTDNNAQCDSDIFYGFDVLEVGDAIAALPNRGSSPLAITGYVYHVQDCLFLDFFRRGSPSNSAAGQYSFFGSANSPAIPCTGHLQVDFTIFTVPGAADTVGHSINNRGDIVGDYHDTNGVRHGFLLRNGRYTTIDPPNAVFTFAMGINDAGVIVGLYFTPDFLEHGFTYNNGQYSMLDFPGSSFTEANGINNSGDIVGDYFDGNGIEHGFIFSHGDYQNVDAPGSVNTLLFSVNDVDLMTGSTYADASSPEFSFLRLGNVYTNTSYPASRDTVNFGLNNAGTFVGFFDDDSGYFDGFVNLFGYYYDIYAPAVYGVNNIGQIVGYGFGESGLVGALGHIPVTPAHP